MTRWVAQTHRNYVSVTPYNWTATRIHGFQATRQPAIWMGESGSIAVIPGIGGRVVDAFEDRGLVFDKETEVVTPSYYSVQLDEGRIFAEQSATSRVGHLRFTFDLTTTSNKPYILIEASRPSVITSTPTNVTYPTGTITVDPTSNQVCGYNSERQDWIIAPTSIQQNAKGFKGYFCARFDTPFSSFGLIQNGTRIENGFSSEGALLLAYVHFDSDKQTTSGGIGTADKLVVNVRVGTSFISTEQAARNLDAEIPDGTSLEETARRTRAAWIEKLDLIKIEGASEVQKEVFYTGVFHSLQYPYEQHEEGKYYSGYDDSVHEGKESYTGYSIWDTFRAEWAWQILMIPERIPGMITSMLADYKEGGWLPMWKNIVETSIMVGTHADSLIAEAVVKGVTGFDVDLAWEAVYKDATVPPEDDWTTKYADREENVGYEVRAGLSSVYDGLGWVADDIHSESASRTLDYAYDDYAVYKLAKALNKSSEIVERFYKRAKTNPFLIFNDETGFMEARNQDGSWAGEDRGWTEGDKWAYSFDVVHDMPQLIQRRGGPAAFVRSLDEHFDGEHNDHTNEPSHHIPYLYALAGAPWKTQEKVREIAESDYNNTATGLSGNEDCGQMSAWYIFSAMGFYPVNPVSGEYVVGSPFFDKLTISLPGVANPLTIIAKDAPTKKYIQSLTVNGEEVKVPIIRHDQIKDGGEVVFEMSDSPTEWGTDVSSMMQSPDQTVLFRREL
ncbi:glycoside hydrolase family 92 protein [Pluteus cervinus]|uniref:Glycoside hydrolase family 92 protein n=1 Tax=Pluteus cervinus TaxID=181527 RepID=A0ACD3AXQ1_9AGAR|nr:glycoside hydrolase family 92 protein [Pluteus cervinus]